MTLYDPASAQLGRHDATTSNDALDEESIDSENKVSQKRTIGVVSAVFIIFNRIIGTGSVFSPPGTTGCQGVLIAYAGYSRPLALSFDLAGALDSLCASMIRLCVERALMLTVDQNNVVDWCHYRWSGHAGVHHLGYSKCCAIMLMPALIYVQALPRNGGEKNYLEYLFPYPRRLATSVYASVAILLGSSFPPTAYIF